MYQLQVTPIVGLPQASGWSQVAANLHGTHLLVCAFAIQGANAGNLGRELAETISQVTIITVEELHAFVSQQVSQVRQLGGELSLAAAVFHRQASFFAAINATVFLKRGEKVGKVMSAGPEVRVVSGSHQATDVVVLSTDQPAMFLQEIGLKLLQGFDIETIVTTILPGVHALSDSSGSALALVAEASQDQPRERWPAPPAPSRRAVPSHSTLDNQDNQLYRAQLPDQAGLSAAPPARRARSFQPVAALQHTGRSILGRLGASLSRTQKESVSALTSDTYVGVKPAKLKLLGLLLVVAVAIGVAIALLVWRNQRAEQLAQAQALTQPLVAELQAAQTLAGEDPIAGREQALEVVGRLEEALTAHQTEPVIAEHLEQELTKARTVYESLSGEEVVDQLPIYYDLRLVKSDFVVSQAVAGPSQAVFVDSDTKQAIILQLEKKQADLVALPDLGRVRDLALNETEALTLDDGIHRFGLTSPITVSEALPNTETTQTAALLATYEQYLYLLSASKRAIYRLAETDGTYGSPVSWVRSARGVAFDQVTSLAVDGDLWLATTDGQVFKLTSGELQDFSITGLAEPFTGSLQLVTSDQLANLYLLEPSQQRVVILTKQGQFLREIKSSSLATATNLLVSEALGKAFAASGSILYEIPL